MKNLPGFLGLFALTFFFLSTNSSFSQTVEYTLTPKENAFMCPFLTPVFMRELTKAGAKEVRKDELLNIHFFTENACPLDSTRIYHIAGEVGFQSKYFTLNKQNQ